MLPFNTISLLMVGITAGLLYKPYATATYTNTATMSENKYVGTWVTGDRHIRQELLPDGRYEEARGTKKTTHQGRYVIQGDHINYVDDTGLTAAGHFRQDVLFHGGYLFYREKRK